MKKDLEQYIKIVRFRQLFLIFQFLLKSVRF